MPSEELVKADVQYAFTPLHEWNSEKSLGNELEHVLADAPENLIELPDENKAYLRHAFWKQYYHMVAMAIWTGLFLIVFIARLLVPAGFPKKQKPKSKNQLDAQHHALGTFLKSEKDRNAQRTLFNALHDPSASLDTIKSLFPTDFAVDPNNESDLPRVLGSDCPECVAIPLQIKIVEVDD